MINNGHEVKTIQTDVLVAGSGGAGFRAAIGAREKGAKCLLVSKGRLARSGATPMAGADLTCHGQGMRRAGFFGEPRDSEDLFFSDIVHQGSFLNDQPLTMGYVVDGPDRMVEMVEWGMKINSTDERAVFGPGTSMVNVLYRQARKLGVDFLEDVSLHDLLTQDGRVVGALALDLKSGEFYRIEAKAVVLATGGWHKAFSVVTGSRELTGDGVAMGLRAGAALTDMEFITFACNVIYWPQAYRGSIFTYVLSLIAGGELENSAGERVYQKYDPWMIDYANRTEWNKSFISLVSGREIKASKTLAHGGLRYVPGPMGFEAFDSQVMAYTKDWVFHDGDFIALREKMKSGEGIEVGPGAEYFEGGLAVDEDYATNLPGLFAAGECASSVFGANRVAAATMEMLTAGARAGMSAGEFANACSHCDVDDDQEANLMDRLLSPTHRKQGINPIEVRKALQKKSQELMGPVRTADELVGYLDYLLSLRRDVLPLLSSAGESHYYNKTWFEALDLVNMVDVMESSCRAALHREESRGVHYREDFPFVDNDQWLKQIMVTMANGDYQVGERPVSTSLMVPPTGRKPYMDFIKTMMAAHSDIGGHH